MNLVSILCRKKLNIISLLFMLISMILIIGLGIYSLALNVDSYEIFINEHVYIYSFVANTLEIIPLLMLGLILVFLISDCSSKNNSFEAFFLVDYRRSRFYFYKLISNLVILSIYYWLICTCLTLLATLRFQNVLLIKLLLETYLKLFVFVLIAYFVSRVLIDLFFNPFFLLIPLVLYYLMRIISEYRIFKYLCYLYPIPLYSFETYSLNFNCHILYPIGYICYFLIVDIYLYNKKDIKI